MKSIFTLRSLIKKHMRFSNLSPYVFNKVYKEFCAPSDFINWLESTPLHTLPNPIIQAILDLYTENYVTTKSLIVFKKLIENINTYKLPDFIYKNKYFHKQLVTEKKFEKFRNIKTNFARFKPAQLINLTSTRNAFIDEVLSNENKHEYHFKDLFCERFFDDSANNVMISLKTISNAPPGWIESNSRMLKYFDVITKAINPHIKNIHVTRLHKLFKASTINFKEQLYLITNKLRNNFITEINNKLQPSENTLQFTGQPFAMLVHAIVASHAYNSDNIYKYFKPITSKTFNNISCSLISNSVHTPYCYNDIKNGEHIIFGFNKIPRNQLAHAKTTDSYSLAGINRTLDEVSYLNDSCLPCDFITFDKFIDQTLTYNELRIKLTPNAKHPENDTDICMPDYLVCFDKISPKILNISKKLNLPIKIIERQAYLNDVKEKNSKLVKNPYYKQKFYN